MKIIVDIIAVAKTMPNFDDLARITNRQTSIENNNIEKQTENKFCNPFIWCLMRKCFPTLFSNFENKEKYYIFSINLFSPKLGIIILIR